MKKVSYIVAALLMASQLQSCMIGSWTCFNKVNDFNSNLTDNKYVNGIVSFFLAPFDLGIASLVDSVILNTLEFWTGSNPMAATKVVTGEDGLHYAIASDKKGGYVVTCQENGKEVDFVFNEYARTWNVMSEGESVAQFAMVDEKHIEKL